MYIFLAFFALIASGQSEACNDAVAIRHSLFLKPDAALDCTGTQPTMSDGVLTFNVPSPDTSTFSFEIAGMTVSSLKISVTGCNTQYGVVMWFVPITGPEVRDYFTAGISSFNTAGNSNSFPTLRFDFNIDATYNGNCMVQLSENTAFTARPSIAPTSAPTTVAPTSAPTTLAPTSTPTTLAPTPSPTAEPTLSPTFAPVFTRDPAALSCHALNALLVAQDCATAIDIERVLQTTFGDAVYYYSCLGVYTAMHNAKCLENMDMPDKVSGWHK